MGWKVNLFQYNLGTTYNSKGGYIDNNVSSEKREFDKLQTSMMGGEFIWLYNDGIDTGPNDPEKNKYPKVDDFMFTHLFYFSGVMRSQDCGILLPIFEIIKAMFALVC